MRVPYGFSNGAQHADHPLARQCAKPRAQSQHLAGRMLHRAKMLTAHRHTTYPYAMEQMQPGDQRPSAVGGAMSKAASAKDRVDSALSRLESMVEERLRAETARSDELAKRLSKLEQQHEELKQGRDRRRRPPGAGDGIYPLAARRRPEVADPVLPSPGVRRGSDVADASPLKRRIRRNKTGVADNAAGFGSDRQSYLRSRLWRRRGSARPGTRRLRRGKGDELRKQLPGRARNQAAGVRLAAAGRGKPRGARRRQGGRERPRDAPPTAPRRWPPRSRT